MAIKGNDGRRMTLVTAPVWSRNHKHFCISDSGKRYNKKAQRKGVSRK